MQRDDDDLDFEERAEEITKLRTRIMRMKGEDTARDGEIDAFMLRTKGDKSPAAWREHARYFKSLIDPPAKKEPGDEKKKEALKRAKGGSIFDWL